MSDDGQGENLERVSEKIARHIVDFTRARLSRREPEFHMCDLVEHVQGQVPETAPDSASRILRDLRQRCVIDYIVVSRKNSHYRITRGPDDQQLTLFPNNQKPKDH